MVMNNDSKRRFWICPIETEQALRERAQKQAGEKDPASKQKGGVVKMPGFDRTGPLGTGPIGRGRGPCGRGLARGFGHRHFAGPIELSKEERVKILKAEKDDIEKALKELEE